RRSPSHSWASRRQRHSEVKRFDGSTTLADVLSRDNLYRCLQLLRQMGGSAPGLDHVKYEDVSPSELADIMGVLSQVIRNGRYRPYPTRPNPIPKAGKSETRMLKIGSICDRVVGKALYEALSPACERVFLDGSYGFRKSCNTWRML